MRVLLAHTTPLIVLLLFLFMKSRVDSDTPCSPKAVCARQCAYYSRGKRDLVRACRCMQVPKERVHASNGHRIEWMRDWVNSMHENAHNIWYVYPGVHHFYTLILLFCAAQRKEGLQRKDITAIILVLQPLERDVCTFLQIASLIPENFAKYLRQ